MLIHLCVPNEKINLKFVTISIPKFKFAFSGESEMKRNKKAQNSNILSKSPGFVKSTCDPSKSYLSSFTKYNS